MKSFTSIIAAISFLADIIAVILFTRDIFFAENQLTLGEAFARTILVVVIFIFAVALLKYSSDEIKNYEGFIAFFGWIYIILAAVIFSGISLKFMLLQNYSSSEYIGYNLLVLLVNFLGYSLLRNVKQSTKLLAIPYLIVGILQICVWIFLIFSTYEVSFGRLFVGNILLFAIVGGYVTFFLFDDNNNDNEDDEDDEENN